MTPSRSPLLLATSALCLSIAAPAAAQDAADTSRIDDTREHLRTRIVIEELSQRTTPELILHRSADNQGWRVTIQQDEGGMQELSTISLVEWAGASYYEYSVTVRPTRNDDQYYALFEAIPNPGKGAPPAAAILQVVWLVTVPRRGTSRWRFITQANHSELDGGELLTLSPIEGVKTSAPEAERPHTLVRRRPEIGQQFCGLGDEEVVETERFAPDKGIFVMEMDVGALTSGADPIQAYIPTTPFEPTDIYGYTLWRAATSDLRTPIDTTTVLRPLELADRVMGTVWAEGAPQYGRGEFVTARIEAAIPLKGFRIFPGNGEDAKTYAHWPRPKRLLIGLSEGQRYIVDIPDARWSTVESKEGLLVELPSPLKTTCLSVMLVDAYEPIAPPPKRRNFGSARAYEQARSEYTAVAIAELTPISTIYGLSPAAAAQEILRLLYAEPDGGRRRKLGAMTRSYSRYLIEALRARLKEEDGLDNLGRAASLLAEMPPDEAMPLMMELVDRVEPGGGAWRALRRSLAAHREAAAGPIFAKLRELDAEATRKRIDLIRLYGRVAPPDQLAALIPQLGLGGRLERDERVRAVAQGMEQIVGLLLAHAIEHIGEDGGRDALKALDTIGRRLLDQPVLPKHQREQLMTLLTSDKLGRRGLIRALHLVAHYAPQGGAEYVADQVLLDHPDALVRKEAATVLAAFESPATRTALEEALHDPSPDVRIEAIRALMEREDTVKATDSVMAYVAFERWTDGLKPALQLLVSVNEPAIDARLEELILDREAPTRAYLTAQAYERARRGVAPDVAAKLLFADETEYEMRRQLIESLGWGDAARGEELLLKVLTDNPYYAQETPRHIETLTKHAMMALGRRRSQKAKDALLNVVRSDPSMERRLTALRALSFYTDETISEELVEFRPEAPSTLREAIDETRSTIGRRIDIAQAEQAIEEFEEGEAPAQTPAPEAP